MPVDPLADVPFQLRLRRYILSVCGEIGEEAAAILEVDSRDGWLRPRCRVSTATPKEGADIPETDFSWLAETLEFPPDPRWTPLGEAFVRRGGRCWILRVSPPLSSEPDTLLCTTPEAQESTLLPRLETLTRGLGKDRKDQLCRAVFAGVALATDAIEVTDRDIRVLYVNPAWEQYTGYR